MDLCLLGHTSFTNDSSLSASSENVWNVMTFSGAEAMSFSSSLFLMSVTPIEYIVTPISFSNFAAFLVLTSSLEMPSVKTTPTIGTPGRWSLVTIFLQIYFFKNIQLIFMKNYMPYELSKRFLCVYVFFTYAIDSRAIQVLVPSRGWGRVAAVWRAFCLSPMSGVSRAMSELNTTKEIRISVSWMSSCCTKFVMEIFKEL